MKQERTKKFKLFDLNKDGKGVEKAEDRTPTLKFFFKLFKRKFTQLIQLNLLMLFQVIPLLVIFFVVEVYGAKTPVITDALYTPLYGISKAVPSATSGTLLDMVGAQIESTLYYSPIMIVVIACMLLFLALTYGFQNVGAAYVLRGLVRGDAVFVFSDYFHAIRRNAKQAFFMGLLDFAFTAVFVIDISFFSSKTGSFGLDFMYFSIIALFVLYIVMRFYIYTLLITFDLSIVKILKNSLIFTALGLKRNIMACLGIILLLALHIVLILVTLAYGISIFLVIPFLYVLSTIGFMATYAAYPIIDRYMITPYLNRQNNTTEELDAPSEDTDPETV